MQPGPNAPSPTSLENLNPIVPSDPVPFWPPAPGWYAVIAVAAVALLVLAWRAWLRRRDDAYRREALAELRGCEVATIPALLKRAALSAWPRERIASLSGPAWHRFLDRTLGEARFAAGAGALLDAASYGDVDALTPEEAASLRAAARAWLEGHDRSLPAAGDTAVTHGAGEPAETC